MKYLITIIMCLVLCACGGGNSVVDAQANVTPTPVVKVACIGDSITAGTTPDTRYGIASIPIDRVASYPHYLQQSLGTNYSVVNFGIPGLMASQVEDIIWGQAVALHPDVLIVQFSANDAGRGVTTQQFQANMLHIVQLAQQAGIKNVLLSLDPAPYKPVPDILLQYDAALDIIAQSNSGVTHVKMFDAVKPEWFLPNWQSNYAYAHPIDNGYQAMGLMYANVIQSTQH